MAHEASYRPEPHERLEIPQQSKSKKWTPKDLIVGTPVFYRGDRYYIETCPESWDISAHVRISDERIRPEPGWVPPNNRTSFYVHPDHLEEAPQGKTPYSKQPTQRAVVEKKRREEMGVKDAGDVVAELLRDCNLDQVYAIAADFLDESEDDLRSKAGHLNNGQQRMWCGNRMRNYMKKLGEQK